MTDYNLDDSTPVTRRNSQWPSLHTDMIDSLRRSLDEDEDLAELADVHSSWRLQEATILASTPMCDDCGAFRAVFQRYARVTIDIQFLQTLT